MSVAWIETIEIWQGVQTAALDAWDFARSDAGLLCWGAALALAGLFVLHRGAAADLLKKRLRRELRDILEKVDFKLRAMQAERDTARGALSEAEAELAVARPDHAALDDMRYRLQVMKRVWIDNDSLEEECRAVLEANPWVLLPDYRPSRAARLDREIGLTRILDEHFGVSEVNLNSVKTPVNMRWRADLCGWVTADTAFDAHASGPRDFYLLVELKSASKTISVEEIDQVHIYAYAIMLLAAETYWGKRIDCLVIGKDVAPGIETAYLRWGPNHHSAIRIIPLTYAQLYERAQWMAWPFLPPTEEDSPPLELTDQDRLEPPPLALPEPTTKPLAPVLAGPAGADNGETAAEAEPLPGETDEAPLDLTELAPPNSEPAISPVSASAAEPKPDIAERQERLAGLLDRFHGRDGS